MKKDEIETLARFQVWRLWLQTVPRLTRNVHRKDEKSKVLLFLNQPLFLPKVELGPPESPALQIRLSMTTVIAFPNLPPVAF
ncbi:hypothetical protein EF384_03665 [Aerococcus agrisoli]|uniref:Uncharacterized protein n=1 Tax=Aerococcus agrisoli TaxID=2487350 RepID=A0A3N4GHA2_9LACT|nr:hypothetical protein EF384_03665 [Aerococcus agrisoli]